MSTALSRCCDSPACRTRAKLVHHVSTIDVLVGSYIPRPFLEIDLPPLPPRVPFSYPQSKWIAEKMVVTARERGLPTTIFRPSIMMGHTETGACHETDYILTALRGFLDLKILPVYTEILNSVTVDFASAALIAASLRPDSIGRIFHIWNTEALPTNETYEWIRSFGYDFDVVPFQEATDRGRCGSIRRIRSIRCCRCFSFTPAVMPGCPWSSRRIWRWTRRANAGICTRRLPARASRVRPLTRNSCTTA
ncbi:SDR family oxidoreductase [Fodinicola feengrottensis]|uniref:SDR family oxidoreductase n=1 Tax=Fodinicola feengrottensis TaxID=435914 RepID=UPI0036F434CA